MVSKATSLERSSSTFKGGDPGIEEKGLEIEGSTPAERHRVEGSPLAPELAFEIRSDDLPVTRRGRAFERLAFEEIVVAGRVILVPRPEVVVVGHRVVDVVVVGFTIFVHSLLDSVVGLSPVEFE